ncbi:MAG: response regulator transcription factor [Deltaproteobacteria bacterium]|nr:response regulator transcription factor [Deltaproteobacteria bacterium]
MTTIVLADDHKVVRQGLRALLEAEPDFRLIGETGDGLEAVRLVERLQPDVLVLDLSLPSLHGLEVIREVRKHSLQTRVVILSMYSSDAYVLQALKNGAAGYVLKDSNAAILIQAIREVAAGRRYLCPELSARVIDAYVDHAIDATPDKYESLTTREREVLHLVAEGYANAQIAARLFLSPRTVETHRANLMRKLGLRNHIDLVHYALRRGILPPE